MSKPKTITIVLNGRYKGHLPLDELELPEAEANVLIAGKIGKVKTRKAKATKATEETAEA